MIILTMYSITALNLLFRNYIDFFKYNSIFLISVILFILKDFLGFKSGIVNMSYTKFDLLLFGLSFIQIILTFYLFHYKKNIS